MSIPDYLNVKKNLSEFQERRIKGMLDKTQDDPKLENTFLFNKERSNHEE